MSALTRDQRRERRKAIAETARIEGVPEAARIHKVSNALARYSSMENGVTPPKDLKFRGKGNEGIAMRILYEVLHTTKSFPEIGRKFKVTRQAVQSISKRAEKAGFDVPKRPCGRKSNQP